MERWTMLTWSIFVLLFATLLLFLLMSLGVNGGFASSSEARAVLPLVIQADVSLLAFWGFILVFRINTLSSNRIELMRNLWQIGFKRDEIRMKLAESEGTQSGDVLKKLNDELMSDANTRREAIDALNQFENILTTLGLLAVMFLVLSICSGLYGIGVAFYANELDPFTFFVPSVFLFTGVVTTIFAVVAQSFRLVKSLEIR